MKIEILHDDEWVLVKVDGEPYYEGHSVPHFTYEELLRKAGAEVLTPEGKFDGDTGEWVSA